MVFSYSLIFLGPEEIALKLKTDIKFGLKKSKVIKNREQYGTNAKPKIPPRGIWKIFKSVMNDWILKILFISGIVTLIINMTTGNHDRSTGFL